MIYVYRPHHVRQWFPRKECKAKSVLNHEGMNTWSRLNMPPVIYSAPRILYQKERKYVFYFRKQNKLIPLFFNALFYSNNFISDESLKK